MSRGCQTQSLMVITSRLEHNNTRVTAAVSPTPYYENKPYISQFLPLLRLTPPCPPEKSISSCPALFFPVYFLNENVNYLNTGSYDNFDIILGFCFPSQNKCK